MRPMSRDRHSGDLNSRVPSRAASAVRDDQRRHDRLRTFHASVRGAVAELTCCAPEAEDLIESFPALLFALVTGYGTPAERENAFRHVLDGGPLKHAGDLLGLPRWLRRLPAQAFLEPFGRLPDSPEFEARIAHLIPSSRILVRPWLSRVLYAYEACHEDYAIWIARQHRLPLPEAYDECFLYLTAWAWHASQKETPAHALLRRPWSPKLSLRRAEEEMLKWRRRLALAYALGSGLDNGWLTSGNVNGFDFVPLLTIDDFIAESDVMDNCLDQYADRISTGSIRVFSIRRHGAPIADIELGPIPSSSDIPAIIQVKAARNRPAPLTIWRAAHAWLSAHAGRNLERRPGSPRLARRRETQIDIWSPYLSSLPPRLREPLAHRLAREPIVRPIENRSQPRRGPRQAITALERLEPALDTEAQPQSGWTWR